MAARLVEIMAESKHKTSKVDKRPTERRIALLLRWLQQIFDRLVYTDYVEGDTELCLRCLELISVYFESGLGTKLLARDGKSANEVDGMMINLTTWFLAVFPPAFSPVEDARLLTRSLQRSNARPSIFTPLVTRFFESVSDDEVPWDMLDQLHSFASALNSNELYELELSMVKQILEEFQSVFGATLGYEPEYERIMKDLRESIKNADGAIRANELLDTRASSSGLITPYVTPLIPRRRCLPLPQSRRTHRRDSSPTPYRQGSPSRSRSPLSPVSSRLKSRTATPPTPSSHQNIPPPPNFSCPFPQLPPSHTPLKKRRLMMAYVELTPWVVKRRRTLAREQLHAPKNLRALSKDHTQSQFFNIPEIGLGTRNLTYHQNRLVRVVDKERHSSADTASSCSPTSSRTQLIASRRCNRAPSPSPGPYDDEDEIVPETSEESEDSEGEGNEFDSDEGDGDDSVLPTSDDPLNLPGIMLARNVVPRRRPFPRATLSVSP